MKSLISSGKPKKLPKPLLRKVVGASMLPTLKPGQVIFVVRRAQLKVGDIVVIEHDGVEKIKRIARIDAARIYVLGDNPHESTDSRTFGWIGRESVIGTMAWPRLRRPKVVE